MIRVLSTKNLQSNQKQFLLNAGFSVIEADFISIKNINADLSTVRDNLILTSQNAVFSVLESQSVVGLKSHPCFCVGSKTSALLGANGFNVIASADSASELADLIISGYAERSFTFFSGNIRRDELPEMLSKNRIDFNEITVYETLSNPKKINAAADAILFFSPSGVESFCQMNQIESQLCFCIGETTAAALPENSRKIIANQPTIENTIIQCINHYKPKIVAP